MGQLQTLLHRLLRMILPIFHPCPLDKTRLQYRVDHQMRSILMNIHNPEEDTLEAPDLNASLPQYNNELPFDSTVIPKPSIWSRISDCLLWPFGWTTYNNPPKPPQSIFDTKNLAMYGKLASQFWLDSLPRWTYQYLLLYLPALYFGRVARIFEEADLGLPEIKRFALQTATDGKFDLYTMEKMPQYRRLRATWQSFIDDVMREWKTFNIISVLLLS
jgi:hypothetical protein